MTAPTDAALVASLARAWTERRGSGSSAANELSDAFTTAQAVPHALFDLDALPAHQLRRLQQLCCDAVQPIEDDARRRVREALVASVVHFVTEHPDAPRVRPRLELLR